MPNSTENFNLESDPMLACCCGQKDCDKREVQQYVLDMLQLTREDYGQAMKVTSGGRCPNHTKEAHRSKPADHQKCQGVDIKVSTELQALTIIAYAIKNGFNAIGMAKSFVHLGHRPELVESGDIATWTY